MHDLIHQTLLHMIQLPTALYSTYIHWHAAVTAAIDLSFLPASVGCNILKTKNKSCIYTAYQPQGNTYISPSEQGNIHE